MKRRMPANREAESENYGELDGEVDLDALGGSAEVDEDATDSEAGMEY